MHRSTGARAALLALLLAVACAHIGAVRAAEVLRVGVLKFGTVNWELDVIKTHGLDAAAGFDLQIVELAGKDATSIALQAGEVDAIVTDWIWVSRQRADGARFTFVPYSTAVGALMVPDASPIRSLADLAGRRLGIAGGPVDKSWLLIRALALERHGIDLDAAVDKVFGAPPLLNEQARSGQVDAVINFWNYLAELEARGFRSVVTVADAARELGITTDLPLLGYVFDERWGETHRAAIEGLVRASREAKELLRSSDTEWNRLRPIMKPADDATFEALKAGFRRGIPTRWGDAERADAARAYAVMAGLGGSELVGKSMVLQPGTFWPLVSY